MPRSYGTGPRGEGAKEGQERKDDEPAGPEGIRLRGPENEAVDAEGHLVRRGGPEDRAEGTERTEPGDPDEVIKRG
jgi:hypothetical protein